MAENLLYSPALFSHQSMQLQVRRLCTDWQRKVTDTLRATKASQAHTAVSQWGGRSPPPGKHCLLIPWVHTENNPAHTRLLVLPVNYDAMTPQKANTAWISGQVLMEADRDLARMQSVMAPTVSQIELVTSGRRYAVLSRGYLWKSILLPTDLWMLLENLLS